MLLTIIFRDNEHHRRSVAAALASGVYILEGDRQKKRDASQALGPPWYEFFHFRLLRALVDDADHSIFGAIYEYNPTTTHRNSNNAPHYVIAFRGTLPKRDSLSRDLELDLQVIRHGLHKTTRAQIAIQAAEDMAATNSANLWLVGHSLGAAMAILGGKHMTTKGIYLETFLFSPPFVSAPVEKIKDERVRFGLRVTGSLITAGIALAMSSKKDDQQKTRSLQTTFSALSSWVPNICVHPADHMCSEYIGYFQHMEKMEQLGAGGIVKFAARHSFRSLMLNAAGREADPLHLLPSASLTVNLAPAPDLKVAHALKQWWQPEAEVHFKTQVYMYS